jgi:hypothetical protein
MLNAPITIFNNIIRTATMPEVEEDLELDIHKNGGCKHEIQPADRLLKT